MEVGSCFRDYDDFKESFLSFKKETKCQYGLRNCVTVGFYNRKNAAYVREEITFMHVKFICVEPRSNNKKKQQLSNGCPAYMVLEYCEKLDRLVIKEQSSTHIHVGLRDSQIGKKRCASALPDNSSVLSTKSLRKLPSKRLQQKSSVDHQVIEKQNRKSIQIGMRDSKIGIRTTSALQKSISGHRTSPPKSETRKRHAQMPTLDDSLIKRRRNSSIHANLKNSKNNTRTATKPPKKLARKTLLQKPPIGNLANEEHNNHHSNIHADLKDSEISTRSGTSSPQKLTRETLQQKPPVDHLVNEEHHWNHSSILADIQDSELNTITGTSSPQMLTRKTLQQKPPVNNLVNEEHNRNHCHKNLRKIGSRALSALQVTKSGVASSLPQEPQKKGFLQTVSVEDTCDELIMKKPFSPIERHTVSLASIENISGSGLERVSDAMKDFMRLDKGSLSSFSVDSSETLNRLSFQTSKMRLLFTKFPESLLLHRVQSNSGHVLYAFLVESKERVGKVVHFTVLNDDTTENVSKMLSVFAQFNPDYSKVKVIFIDVSFLHKSALKETFPTAQTLLSVYHTVKLIEKKVRKLSSFKYNMEIALRDVVFSTSAENRMSLSQMLKQVLDPDFHQFLQTHWFSSEMLWYMHVKKGLLSCSTYMDSLQLITHKITNLFSKQPSLETSILYVLEHADYFNNKGVGNLNQSSLKSTHKILKKVNREPTANLGNASLPALVTPGRFTSLPTPAMLLPKLAAMLPKMAFSRSTKLPPMQAQPAPVQIQPAPQPAPVETQPAPAETQPAPAETQPAPAETQPAPAETQPAPAETQPAPAETQPAPAETQPAPAETQPAPAEAQPAPAQAQPAPAQAQPAPAQAQPSSAQAQPVPVQAQPLPELVLTPPVSQASVPTQPPPVLSQLEPVQPQLVLVEPLPSQAQPVLQSPVSAQPPPILSHPPPVASQPLPTLAQPPPTQTMLLCKPVLLRPSRPTMLRLSKPALVLPQPTKRALSLLLPPKPKPLLPKVEPLRSESRLLMPNTKQSVVTFSSHPPPKASKDEDSMLVVLRKLCTDVAYQLCLGEWEVAKKSCQVVEVHSTRIIVRLLEDVQKVSTDGHTCDCYFNSRYRLPCRHIFTILHKNKRLVEEDMICHRWQRKYQQPQLTEDDILGRVRCSAVTQKAGDERFARMKSLSKELGNLLLQCEGAEFKERCSTLHTIVDSWNQHQKQEDIQVGALNNLGDLPFLWVKQEEPEMGSSYITEI